MKREKAILFGPLPPPYGGVSVFMNAIRRPAIEMGVRVWSYKSRSPDDDTRYVDHRRFEHIWAAIQEGRRARITDSTHFHLEYPHFLLAPLWIIAKAILRFRWIKILHDSTMPTRYENFNLLQRLLFRAAVRNIDEFIVYSRELESWLVRRGGYRGKISFIPLLMPLPPGWGDVPFTHNEIFERYSRHKQRVCSIGVFIPSYGFGTVAEAIEKLRADTKEDIGLLLIDGTFAGDQAYRESILSGREWIYVAENVPHPTLKHVFSITDAFVRTVEHESFGLSRIEALWCGVPVLATPVGETRGMMLHDFGDVEGLRQDLQEVLSGNAVSDAAESARDFHDEAEDNLKNYLRVITGEDDET